MKYLKSFQDKDYTTERLVLSDDDYPYKCSKESYELWRDIKDNIDDLNRNRRIFDAAKKVIRPIIDDTIEKLERIKIIGDVNKYNLSKDWRWLPTVALGNSTLTNPLLNKVDSGSLSLSSNQTENLILSLDSAPNGGIFSYSLDY